MAVPAPETSRCAPANRKPRLLLDLAPVDWLEMACQQAGCTQRQTRIVLAACSGHTDAEIAEGLAVSEQAVRDGLISARRKLERVFPEQERPSVRTGDVIACMRRGRAGAARTPVYDELGRVVGGAPNLVAGAIGYVGLNASDTDFLLELACRLTGQPLPQRPGQLVRDLAPKPSERCFEVERSRHRGERIRSLCRG